MKLSVSKGIITRYLFYNKKPETEKVTYDLEDFAAKDGVKRPIKINDSNNIFFINHNDRNRAVKIDPGEYN